MSSKPVGKLEDCKVLSTEPLPSSEARWTKLVKITYTDPTGQKRTWESAERTTRPAGAKIDGVGVVALIHTSDGTEILLQKQFRPPVEAPCIEVPAGLLDAGESAEECGIRELLEETGYVGTASKERKNAESQVGGEGIMFNDPGFTNTNLKMIHLSIDPNDPANKAENRKTNLEDNEFIDTFSVRLTDLWKECRKLESQGYAIDARVGTLAEGVELGKMLAGGKI